MKDNYRLCFIILFVLALIFTSANLDAAPYYSGKTITIVVGYSPGGGYDRMARMMAKHLPKHIPGKPNIIVQNMPGASSIIACNYLYNMVKPDGLTIGAIERGLPLAQLLEAQGIKFDLRKFSWIGSTAVEATILTIRTDLAYKSLDDLRQSKSPIMLGITGPADNVGQFSTLLQEFVGINFKMISYPSNSDILLAIERKELDGVGGSYTAMKPYIERGLLRPVVRGRLSEPEIENLPIDEELTTNQTGKTIMAIRTAPCRIGRPYVAPPNTPSEIMNILRKGFRETSGDPELKKDSIKLKTPVTYIDGPECLKTINYVLDQPQNIVKEIGRYLKF